MSLKNKKILLGISGSIAVKKVPNLIQLLIKQGAIIEVVATANALKLIDIGEIEEILGKKVWVGMWGENPPDPLSFKGGVKFPHIDLAKWADIVLLAPATANLIGKIANGLASNLLTTILLAFEKDIFIAPAMNTRMWNNFFVQENLRKLELSGQYSELRILKPVEGKLACGEEGIGKMMEPEEIVKELTHPQPLSFQKEGSILKGKTILITAGPTREYIDPVRYITNGSSGKMGFALAEEAVKMGGKVVLIGHVETRHAWSLRCVKYIQTNTTEEMFEAVKENINKADVFISAAAVCDFKPEKVSKNKMKKTVGTRHALSLRLMETVDILKWVGDFKKPVDTRHASYLRTVGFALETENLIENAKKKLKEKNLDLIIANKPSNIGSDSGEFYFIDQNKSEFKKGTKNEIAREILLYNV